MNIKIITHQFYKHSSTIKLSVTPVIHIQIMSSQNTAFDHPFEEELDDVNLYCQRCQDYLCFATETECGHVFCRSCIEEYLLYFDQCPVCKKSLRRKHLYSNICLDSVILGYLRADPQSLRDFQLRLSSYKHFKNAERSGPLRVGMALDVRDIGYVWTTGNILSMHYSESSSEPQMLAIQYQSGMKEDITIFTGRLAPRGFNTTRKELPHYKRNKVVMERNGQQHEFKQWKKAPKSESWKIYK